MKGIFAARFCCGADDDDADDEEDDNEEDDNDEDDDEDNDDDEDDEDAGDGASRGIEIGKLGLAVAVAGGGGSESRSGVSPGTRSATTFWTWFAFYDMFRSTKSKGVRKVRSGAHIDTEPVWRRCVCDEVEDKISEILHTTSTKNPSRR